MHTYARLTFIVELVSFNQTLGCLRKTPTRESFVKSHDNVCNSKTRFTPNQLFHLIG